MSNALSRRRERYTISITPDSSIEKARVTCDSELWRQENEVTHIPTGIGAGNKKVFWNGTSAEADAKRRARQRKGK